MARKTLHQDLYVYMNGRMVGMLVRKPSGRLMFTYHQEWLNWENRRAISLSMPLTEVPFTGVEVENYFDNLLPDSEIIRQRIQTRFNAPSKKSFDLLSFIGGDCVGALQLLTHPINIDVKKIQAETITNKQIGALLKNYKTAPLGMKREVDFRISIAGAQEKTALLWHDNKWHLPQGVTATSHIVKLPIGMIEHSGIDLSESVENEWLCLRILSEYGLPVNEARIIEFDDVKTLVVERFDRIWADKKRWLIRLPQEDLCQALRVPAALKYESDGGPGIQNIMKVLLGSQNAADDRKQFIKSVFLFWILGAIDGHAKNFSLQIGTQGRYQLSPLYDVISAYPLAHKHQLDWQKIKMAMALKGKNTHYEWDKIRPRHWLSMAEKCQFSTTLMQKIIEETCDQMENVIDRITKSLPPRFPTSISKPIFSGMKIVKERCVKNSR